MDIPNYGPPSPTMSEIRAARLAGGENYIPRSMRDDDETAELMTDHTAFFDNQAAHRASLKRKIDDGMGFRDQANTLIKDSLAEVREVSQQERVTAEALAILNARSKLIKAADRAASKAANKALVSMEAGSQDQELPEGEVTPVAVKAQPRKARGRPKKLPGKVGVATASPLGPAGHGGSIQSVTNPTSLAVQDDDEESSGFPQHRSDMAKGDGNPFHKSMLSYVESAEKEDGALKLKNGLSFDLNSKAQVGASDEKEVKHDFANSTAPGSLSGRQLNFGEEELQTAASEKEMDKAPAATDKASGKSTKRTRKAIDYSQVRVSHRQQILQAKAKSLQDNAAPIKMSDSSANHKMNNSIQAAALKLNSDEEKEADAIIRASAAGHKTRSGSDVSAIAEYDIMMEEIKAAEVMAQNTGRRDIHDDMISKNLRAALEKPIDTPSRLAREDETERKVKEDGEKMLEEYTKFLRLLYTKKTAATAADLQPGGRLYFAPFHDAKYNIHEPPELAPGNARRASDMGSGFSMGRKPRGSVRVWKKSPAERHKQAVVAHVMECLELEDSHQGPVEELVLMKLSSMG